MRHIFNQTKRCLIAGAAVFISLSVTALDVRFGNAEVKKINSSSGNFVVELPSPVRKGQMSLEEALSKRESVRSFSPQVLTRQEISQLLWAAQGVTRNRGGRTAPSAGALFPLEIYVVLKEGVFQYSPGNHHLIRTIERDSREILAQAALNQNCLREAPALFVITGVYERTAGKYSGRAERYVKMEAGHAVQNLLLQATSLGLGATPVGAFQDKQVQQSLQLPADHEPLYLIPVGRRK